MSLKCRPCSLFYITFLYVKNSFLKCIKLRRRHMSISYLCRRNVDLMNVPLMRNHNESVCWKKYAIFWFILSVSIAALTLGLVFGLSGQLHDYVPSRLGAVVSNAEGCAEVGGQILKDGGSAIDAAIATLLCESVIMPHSMGLGGGFVATIYTKETGKVETLIARETAPAAAHQNMFVKKEITGGYEDYSDELRSNVTSVPEFVGALSAGVPSELYGYWCLHAKYGKLPWKVLFEPAIELCKNGHRVSKPLAAVLTIYEEHLRSEPSMAEIFINSKTNQIFKQGEIMYRSQLGETLRIVADEGPEVMYRGGRIGKMLIEDIQNMGGIITEQDLQNYDVRWEEPIVAKFTNDLTLYTTPLPTSGPVLAFILHVMEPLFTSNEEIYWQRLIETFKHAYGHRTDLGDLHYEPEVAEIYERLISPEFASEVRKLIKDDETSIDLAYYGAHFANFRDSGTANMAVIAPNGDAITVTSTVNSHFGAKVRSRSTGIILNDEMDDFSTPGVINTYGIPASSANFIKPGKRPMSSTCPSIVLDKQGNIRLMIGGAGGSKITTSVAQTILRYLVLDEPLSTAVNSGRIHHQLAPMYVDVEQTVPEETMNYLLYVGHELNFLPMDKAYSALTAIGMKRGQPEPVSDIRRLGSTVIVKENHRSTSE